MSRKPDVGGALAFGGARVAGTAASGARGGRRRELREEQKIEIKEAFELFDSEKTGKMDYHELKVCFIMSRYTCFMKCIVQYH